MHNFIRSGGSFLAMTSTDPAFRQAITRHGDLSDHTAKYTAEWPALNSIGGEALAFRQELYPTLQEKVIDFFTGGPGTPIEQRLMIFTATVAIGILTGGANVWLGGAMKAAELAPVAIKAAQFGVEAVGAVASVLAEHGIKGDSNRCGV